MALSGKKKFYGILPPVGSRIRMHHPWLDDGVVGTVTKHELIDANLKILTGTDGAFYGRYRIHLTGVMHWDSKHEWGPQPDTYMDNLANSWEYEQE